MVHDIAIPLFYLRENSLSLRTDAIIFFRLDKPLDPGELPPIKERIRGLREELSIDEVAAEVFDAFGIGGAKFTELDCLTLPDPSAITRKMLYGRTSAKCPEQSALVKPPNPEARTEQILFGMSYCPLPTTSNGFQVMFHSAEYVANSFSRPHIAIAERISPSFVQRLPYIKGPVYFNGVKVKASVS